MKTEIVTAEYAGTFTQEKKFGVISEGCIGVWGEGDTIQDAIEDAEKNQAEYSSSVDLSSCWIMEIK